MELIFNFFLFYFTFYLTISCTKQISKNDPRLKKPELMSDELFCVGCVAFSTETSKLLKGRISESDVFHALENVCKAEYNNYCNVSNYVDFSPKEVSEACFTFVDLYDDYHLENFFKKKENNEKVSSKLCYEITKVILK